MDNFYTYVHAKPNGVPFYVGKGKCGRAHNFTQRNQYHKRIVAKYGKENIIVKIVNGDLTEERAFYLECETIACLKKMGYAMANLTDGGEGPSGWKATAEQRKKNSLAQIGNKHGLGHKHTEEHNASQSARQMGNTHSLGHKHTTEFCAAVGARMRGSTHCVGIKHSAAVCAATSARLVGNQHALGMRHTDEWRAANSARLKGRGRGKQYTFVHKDTGETFTGHQTNFMAHSSVPHAGNVSRLARGLLRSLRGWFLVGEAACRP